VPTGAEKAMMLLGVFIVVVVAAWAIYDAFSAPDGDL
jgi:hypothetical protein